MKTKLCCAARKRARVFFQCHRAVEKMARPGWRAPAIAYLVIILIGPSGLGAEKGAAPTPNLDEVANLTKPTLALEGKYHVLGERNRNLDAQWFSRAAFGLFMHWGPESAQGSGEPWTCMVSEGGPEKSGIGPVRKYGFHPPSEFWEVARKWNPNSYNPDKWMAAAKEAGFTYAVLTTKHHLGYAIWPSKVGDMGVRQFLGGRDLLKPYLDACRSHGIKAGLYYSGMDWHFDHEFMNFSKIPGKKLNWRHEEVADLPARPKDYRARFRAFDETQGRELLTQYGKIDLWWPDGSSPFTVAKIREMQPGIVINNRTSGWYGDYATPEGAFLSRVDENLPIIREMLKRGYLWECCNLYNGGSWHYNPESEKVSEAGKLLWHLAIARSFGGNLLADIAPRPNGEMPDQFYERCRELAAWMAHSREAIYDMDGGGVYPEQCNVPVTIAANRWYLHSPPKHWQPHWGFPARIDSLVLQKVPKPSRVTLLRTGTMLPFDYDLSTETVRLTVPAELRTETTDVVLVELTKQAGERFQFRQWK